MTDCPFSAPCLYFLISVYEIPGLLKVGDISFKPPKKASELVVKCADRHNIEATC